MAAFTENNISLMHERLNRIFSRNTSFGNETGELPMGEFDPHQNSLQMVHSMRVLVVGAGGLGCEILKDLALSGFRNIDVIDLDTIDVSNLNRQFLFRKKDVGRAKAEVAAEFIRGRVPGCNVTAHVGKIQDKDHSFYRQFKVIVSGLDNIDARRWLNSLLVDFVELETEGEDAGEIRDPDQVIPFIDGGTEGFRGQVRVIVPRVTSCFECSLFAFPPQKAFPMCTIAQTPRIPEHCIAYAYMVEWEKHFTRAIDKDSPDDMKWIFERALARAEEYRIPGVTYFRTMGVVKNIIPAIASTNAIISAASVLEATKIVTYCSQTLNVNMSYGGTEGVYTNTFVYEQNPECIVCSPAAARRKVDVPRTMLLEDFMTDVLAGKDYQLKSPSIAASRAGVLYMQNPKTLREQLAPNLLKPMGELVQTGDVLNITDPNLHSVSLGLEVVLV